MNASKISQAARLGTQAGGAVEPGPRTPCQNAELMELMRGNKIGEGIPIMDAYTTAFDAAREPVMRAELIAAIAAGDLPEMDRVLDTLGECPLRLELHLAHERQRERVRSTVAHFLREIACSDDTLQPEADWLHGMAAALTDPEHPSPYEARQVHAAFDTACKSAGVA